MKAQLKEASTFKKVIDAIKDLVNEANFICTDEGIQLQAMDQSHVTLVTLTLLAEGFTDYECMNMITIGIRIPLLYRILKCAENSDILTLEANEEDDIILITIEAPNGSRSCTFELTRMDIEGDMVEIPDTEYMCSVKMPCTQFKKIITDLSSLGETCMIEIKSSEIQFQVSGDMGKATFVIQEDTTSKKQIEHTSIDNSSDEPIKQSYALKYLSQFVKTTGISDQISMFIKAGWPLYVSYDMGEIGSVGYYLAPKIEE